MTNKEQDEAAAGPIGTDMANAMAAKISEAIDGFPVSDAARVMCHEAMARLVAAKVLEFDHENR
jgi:hypothetical protein